MVATRNHSRVDRQSRIQAPEERHARILPSVLTSALPADSGHTDPEGRSIEKMDLARILFVALAALAVWLRLWEPFPKVSLSGLVATLIGGYPIFKEALASILQRRMTMELSMTIALVAALAIGEFFTSLVITLFVLIAEVLEGLTVRRGRRAIHDMIDLLPKTTSVRRPHGYQDVRLAEIRPGDIIMVRPGSRIPVDGAVSEGHSFVDQAAITGESMPAEKLPGAEVYAGTINQSGALEIRVERVGRDTAFGKIIEAVERAEHSRAPIQRVADRLAGYLVYFALGAAALTFILTHNVRSTISVVIVAGACGIAAGTPLGILGAIGRAARHGAIVKGGLYMETLAKVDTVLLDKTGTVTYGSPEVSDVRPVGVTPATLLEAAATAELRSEHPVAKAILKKASELSIRIIGPDRFDYSPGKGIMALSQGCEIVAGNQALMRDRSIDGAEFSDACVDSEVLVARDGRFLGAIQIADTVRPEAKEAVAALRALGIRIALLTGDRRGTALRVADRHSSATKMRRHRGRFFPWLCG